MTYPQPSVPDSLPPSLQLRRRPIEILDGILCIAYIILGLTVAWTLTFGPARFHDTPSVKLIAALGVHWWIVGGVYALYSALLTNKVTRVGGWALGAVLFSYYLASLIHAATDGYMVSALAAGAAIAAVLSQISGLVRSMIAAEWRSNADRGRGERE